MADILIGRIIAASNLENIFTIHKLDKITSNPSIASVSLLINAISDASNADDEQINFPAESADFYVRFRLH